MPKTVLITTTWLDDTDEAHRILVDAGFQVRYARGGVTDRSQLVDVSGLVAGLETIDADWMAAAPALRVISRTGVGYDNVDINTATERGIVVCATPGVNRRSVAEYTLALMLNLARAIPHNTTALRAGEWSQHQGVELSGKTVGIVGFGAVGQDVSALCHAMGMTVVAYDPYQPAEEFIRNQTRSLPLDELLAESDFVTLHLALSDDSHHLIDAEALGRMKPSAYLVNAARGGIVDETALLEALTSGRIAGAALDTFEVEPLPDGNPILTAPNLLATAHMGGATIEGRRRSGIMAAESVVTALTDGVPPHAVNMRDERAGGTR